MRKLVVTENITLDGVIDLAGVGSIRWIRTSTSPTSPPANGEHQAAADALLVGRNTFESFRGFWFRPKQHRHHRLTALTIRSPQRPPDPRSTTSRPPAQRRLTD